jgi:hypothetical protein
MRRGRRDRRELRPGDAVDFWRVEDIQPGSLLRLRAEMKLPGRAWLQFEAKPLKGAQTLLTQTAFFAPKGLGGLAYWYGLYPVHRAIFSGMIRRLAGQAEEGSRQEARGVAKPRFRRQRTALSVRPRPCLEAPCAAPAGVHRGRPVTDGRASAFALCCRSTTL